MLRLGLMQSSEYYEGSGFKFGGDGYMASRSITTYVYTYMYPSP